MDYRWGGIMGCEFKVVRTKGRKKFWVIFGDILILLGRGQRLDGRNTPHTAKKFGVREQVTPQEVLDELGVSPQDLLDWTTSGKRL